MATSVTAPPAPPAAVRTRPPGDAVVPITLGLLLVATAVMYLWALDINGYANAFYSAAAQAGGQDWTAWFFGSSDMGNSITVDKPPASLWLMGLSVRLFGLNSWAILVPQALLGVASVAVLYATVRRTVTVGWPALHSAQPTAIPRRFAHWAGIAAGLMLAVTPVATLMFRFNNPDALLVFTLVVGAALTLRAAEKGSRWLLIAAGAAIGVGFLTKMMQAFIILPILALVYVLVVSAGWKKKLIDLLCAAAAVIVSSGWYIAIVELVPAENRPFIGGSQTNSIVELILSYNGFGRLTGTEVGSVGGGSQFGPGSGGGSLLRLFTDVSGGMVSWLIPAALLLSIVALVQLRKVSPDPVAGDLLSANRHLRGGVVMWLGWLVITGAVFSFMSGIYHDYYTIALAPAIAGSVALGGAVVWAHRSTWLSRITLASAALGSAVWATVLLQQAGGIYAALGWAVLAVGVLSAVGFVWVHKLPSTVASMIVIAALAMGNAGPTAYSLQTVSTAHTGSIVTAGPVTTTGGVGGNRGQRNGSQSGPGAGGQGGTGQGGQGPTGQNQTGSGTTQGQGMPGQNDGQPPTGAPGSTDSQSGSTDDQNGQPPSMSGYGPSGSGSGSGYGQMPSGGGAGGLLNGSTVDEDVLALLTEAGSTEVTWVAATTGSQNAANYQLASGYAVMPIGGFNGSDPSPTLEQFQQYVAQGRIHYYIDGSIGGQQNGGSDAAEQIRAWVEETYTAQTVGNTTIYDLTENV